MTIKEVSEKFQITQDTLRYYERVGMIPPVTRTAGGGNDRIRKAVSGRRLHDPGETPAANDPAGSAAGTEIADQ